MSEEPISEDVSTATEEVATNEIITLVTEEAPPAEEQVVEEPPAPEAPDFSRQFAAIAKKERALRQREATVKDLEARIQELEGSSGKYGEIERLAKENPAAILGQLGIDYDELTQQVINEGSPTPEQGLKLENSKLRERLEKLEGVYESQREAAERQQLETARNTLVDNVKTFVNNDDQYGLIQHNGAHELVAEVMQQHYIKTQEVMEYSKAARIVEDHFENEAERLFGSKKVQEKWKARFAATEEQIETPAETTKERPKTLSNKHAAQKTEPLTGLETKEESLRRIAQMIRWGE